MAKTEQSDRKSNPIEPQNHVGARRGDTVASKNVDASRKSRRTLGGGVQLGTMSKKEGCLEKLFLYEIRQEFVQDRGAGDGLMHCLWNLPATREKKDLGAV